MQNVGLFREQAGTGASVFIAFVLFVKKEANDRLYATPDQVSSCMSNTV